MIKKIKILTLALLVSVPLTSSLANDDSADETLQTLKDKLANIESVQSDFVQVIVDDRGVMIDESSGRFELERPNKFKWLVRDPYEQDIVADGESLWQFDRDIEQITRSNLAETLNNSPAGLLSQSEIDLEGKYDATLMTSSDKDVSIYVLTPLDQDALYEELRLEFYKDAFKAFTIQDNLGQSTLVEFTETTINQPFADDHFNFVIPDDVDFIDSRTDAELQTESESQLEKTNAN